MFKQGRFLKIKLHALFLTYAIQISYVILAASDYRVSTIILLEDKMYVIF